MSSNYPFDVGPIAPERNPPINPQYYEPSRFVIEDLSLGITTTVKTTVDHNYVVGQLVRLLIPSSYGSVQLNEQTGYVIQIPSSNEVVTNIYSVGANAFISSGPSWATTKPQILGLGDVNTGYISSTGPLTTTTTIPGAFINISPL
tara:strand:- start:382 stop:819 length:438 start_codon:yes stop_codon:yes gene_type:complete